MSANPSSRQSGRPADAPAPRVRARLLWLLLLVGAAAVAVLWGRLPAELLSTSLAGSPLAPTAPTAPVAAVAAGVVAIAALVLLVGQRSRRLRRERTHNALAWFEGLHVCGAVQVRSSTMSPAGDTDDRSERVLRLQVRSLERALEGQDHRVAEAAREGQRTALLTLDALRDSLAHQPGDIALSRLQAALRRLGTAPGFDRPTLTAGPSGGPLVGFGAPQALASAAALTHDPTAVPNEAPTAEAPAHETPVAPAPPETPVVPPEPVADSAPIVPVPPVVRPVPAPKTREAPTRSRRRLRRSVAA